MSSSPIDAAGSAASIVAPGPDPAPQAIDIRQRSRLKRLLPQTMFGRSLLLIVVPLIVVQIIAIWVFYARHWETVSRRLASDVAGDIGMLVEAMKFADNELELARLMENASALTNIDFLPAGACSRTSCAPRLPSESAGRIGSTPSASRATSASWCSCRKGC